MQDLRWQLVLGGRADCAFAQTAFVGSRAPPRHMLAVAAAPCFGPGVAWKWLIQQAG